ncbi:MAG: hypothetical protein QOJ20_2984 [Mycobacterium sp.]|jgi:hypothetical protein|nr:hypothetical protein [Mycobacterium sp.]MDT5281789.1 hypothetical protein [Mycobacterium sp.]
MKKLTIALSAATAIAAATAGLASPALASTSAIGSGPAVVTASGANIATNAGFDVPTVDPGMLAQCGVHVNYNGADVNVVWC